MNSALARLPRALLIGTATATLAAALAACSTSSSTSDTGRPNAHTTTRSSAPKAKAASAPKSTSALAGKWSGTYSGAYNGTFKLSWHQTRSHLHGTITISNPGNTLPINGTVNGTAISFGTVGSTAITYTGTVSGNSMSGTYKVATGNGSTGGPWRASKS
jgi:hypothetical protein